MNRYLYSFYFAYILYLFVRLTLPTLSEILTLSTLPQPYFLLYTPSNLILFNLIFVIILVIILSYLASLFRANGNGERFSAIFIAIILFSLSILIELTVIGIQFFFLFLYAVFNIISYILIFATLASLSKSKLAKALWILSLLFLIPLPYFYVALVASGFAAYIDMQNLKVNYKQY
ncbi:hypothetical protein [Candidatus Acidianus copahuensis]|nr:hypothetical protein [Candidatus Acidianus copahuensis]